MKSKIKTNDSDKISKMLHVVEEGGGFFTDPNVEAKPKVDSER